MTHSSVFFLTEAELQDLDLARFHEQCNPKRNKNCQDYILGLGQIELHAAGLVALPPDELVPYPIFRGYVRQLVHEWPSYWLFLRIDPPHLLYHLAAQCQHVIITSNDRDGSYRFSIPAEELIALLLSQYGAAMIEADACGVPWVVIVGRLWDVLRSLNIQLFSLIEPELDREHQLPFVHKVTAEEIRNADISKVRCLFTAAVMDEHTARIMRGSIQFQYADDSKSIDPAELKAWAEKILAEMPESIFLLTLDDYGLLPLLKHIVPINSTVQRLEATDLFHILMTCYPALVELEEFIGNPEAHAIARLRTVFRGLGYGFCF